MTARFALILFALLPSSAATRYYVTIAGLGGEPDYEARFTQQSTDVRKLLSGDSTIQVEVLQGPNATRANLQATLQKIAASAKPEDEFVLLLIGHGSFDGLVYKFNVVGPDVSADELRTWLDRIPARQLVINTTQSSGASIPILRRENRVVVTATRSGNERIATVFARYWIEAMRDASADTDKNDVVSALEAFRFADQKAVRFYETQKRVATEHALLEDTGKGDGVRNPAPDNGQGLLAGRFPVVRIGAAQQAMKDPAKQALFAKKEQLEQQIDRLKYQKAAMPVDEYRRKLQALLLELARTQEQIDQ